MISPSSQVFTSSLNTEKLDAAGLTAREMISLPHYALVQAAAGCLAKGKLDVVSDVLFSIAATHAERSAIILSDLYVITRKSNAPWKEAITALTRDDSWPTMRDAISTCPTLDAHMLRTELLGHDIRESSLPLLSLITHLRGETDSDIEEPLQFLSGTGGLTGLKDALSGRFHSRTPKGVQLNAPIRSSEAVGRVQALCSEFFSSVAGICFPPEKYGYSTAAERLALKPTGDVHHPSLYRSFGGDEGRKTRETAAKMRAEVAIPWPATPDTPGSYGHQCVDSASSARSFLVSHGVPADVYLVNINGLYHNICVGFCREGGGLTPVVVDASPFEGGYALSGENGATFWRPQSIENVYGVRAPGLPFFDGSLTGRGVSGGLLPWAGMRIDEGRLVLFAGVHDAPIYPERAWERGTPEYYGRGKRERHPAFAAYFMPHQAAPSESSFCSLKAIFKGDECELLDEKKKIPRAAKNKILAWMGLELPRLVSTIQRLEIPLGKVEW